MGPPRKTSSRQYIAMVSNMLPLLSHMDNPDMPRVHHVAGPITPSQGVIQALHMRGYYVPLLKDYPTTTYIISIVSLWAIQLSFE